MAMDMMEKPLTEAQRIVARLESEFGMAPAAIANEIKLKSHIINNIRTRHTTGNLQLPRLRRLMAVMESGPTQNATPFSANPASFADIAPDAAIDALRDASDDPARFDVSADEPSPPPQKSLKDKASDILGSIIGGATVTDTPKTKRTKADEGEQEGLIAQLVPLAALLIVSAGTFALHDPYKPCAPTMSEASAIAYPIIRRAVRELDARKKLSEGTQDAIIILLAVTAYGQRALGTYRQIHAMEVERERSNGQPNNGAHGATIAGFTTAPAAADPARSAVHHGGAPVAFSARAGGGRGPSDGGPRGAGGSADERRANDAISALLAADTAGRRQLGLG